MNIDTAISQYMYAQQYGVTLKQWCLDKNSQISYSDKENYLNIVKYINYYLLPAFFDDFVDGDRDILSEKGT